MIHGMNTDFPRDYPPEYIHGYVDFFGKTYRITPDVLIPRLETESLVRRARKILTSTHFSSVYDIGSGSGIIGVSVADLTDDLHFVDISLPALRIAEENFSRHFPQKHASFHHSDLLTNTPLCTPSVHDPILILANLPYVKLHDWESMSTDTVFEPPEALFGGAGTGFELYETLFQSIHTHGLQGMLIIEFGYDQRQKAEDTITSYQDWSVEFFADYSGIERFAQISF